MRADASEQRPIVITGPFLLLVEGKDEECFFEALLGHMGISNVQVLPLAGKDNLARLFPAVCRQLDRVRAYAIVRDADTGAADAFRSVCGVLEANGQPAPDAPERLVASSAAGPRAGVYILPGYGEDGMLEDLCMMTVPDHPAMPCVESFIQCIRERLPSKSAETLAEPPTRCQPKNMSKARAMAFLAAMHEEVHRVGEAARKGYWNFEHGAVGHLKAFLRELVGE